MMLVLAKLFHDMPCEIRISHSTIEIVLGYDNSFLMFSIQFERQYLQRQITLLQWMVQRGEMCDS